MRTVALLVVDFQRDFLEADGRLPVATHQVAPLLATVNAAIGRARDRGIAIVYIGNEFRKSDWVLNVLRRRAAIEGSRGAELDPRLTRVEGAYFPKSAADSFSNPALDVHLRTAGTRRVLVAGVFAEACIRATARGAKRHGYGVTVLADGVAGKSDSRRDRALRSMAAEGMGVEATARAIEVAIDDAASAA